MASMNNNKKLLIKKKKLILAEGIDAYFFLIWALEAYKIEGIQVIDFGGISELNKFIQALTLLDNFENVNTIIIARDAETDYKAAISSINDALSKNKFDTPKKPFEFTQGLPKIASMIFPGFDESNSLENGCLEDLCLKTVSSDLVVIETDIYLNAVEKIDKNHKLKHKVKSRIHAYLSVKNKYVGFKLGEAAKSGAWDWNHPCLKPFLELLKKA